MTPELHAAARTLLARLVAVPSPSGEERAVADELAAWFHERGLSVNRHEDNLWVSVGSGPGGLLLNSHLDVVPASEGHPFPPFEPTIDQGALWGRGAVDAKGSVASMAVAFAGLVDSGWRPEVGSLVAAFTTCEEAGWPYNGLESVRPALPEVRSAVIGEPTGLQPCIAQKGLLILKVVSKGRSAHAARPSRGENALYRAAEDLRRIEHAEFERVHPVLGRVSMVPTVMAAGSARNMIPDRAEFWVDVRSTPSYSHDELIEEVRAMLEGEVVVHSDRLVPVDTDPRARIVRVARSVTEAEPFGSPTASDWIFVRDLEAVKLGPGESRLSHTAREHLPLTELDRAVDVYMRLVREYFEEIR